MFAIAAETGWPEERVLHLPLARLAQYQHCLLRRNAVRTHWSISGSSAVGLKDHLAQLRIQWCEAVDADTES
ncbi:hypothetical protein N9Y81_02645 [Akkermansiaceae bacterium]|nr:hypothetical protein [Akkermansiaceae bacterium]